MTWHAEQEPGCLARGWFPPGDVRSLGVLSQRVATEGFFRKSLDTQNESVLVVILTDVTDVTGFGPQG